MTDIIESENGKTHFADDDTLNHIRKLEFDCQQIQNRLALKVEECIKRSDEVVVLKAEKERLLARVAELADALKPLADCHLQEQYAHLGVTAHFKYADIVKAKEVISTNQSTSDEFVREVEAKVLEEVQMLFIKWYVSEREARFVFESIERRDKFVRIMIGAN